MNPRLMHWLGMGMLFAAYTAGWQMLVPSASARPEVESLERIESEAGWRITWSSEAGASYKVQRNPTLKPEDWEDVDVVVAVGASTSLTDTGVDALAKRMFWRVVRLGAEDIEPPVVSILQVRRVSDDDEPALELTVQAEDNVGVVGVSFTEGGVLLGAGTEGPVGTWKRIVPLDVNDPDPRQFQASAVDAAGNTGFSEIYTYVPGIQSADLVPLDDEGNPVGDALVGVKPDGTLNPFAYLPDFNAGSASGRAFRIDFPDGGELIDIGGVPHLRAGRVRVGFGEDSPTQLLNADGEPGFLGIDAGEGEILTLQRGELAYEDLAELMGIDPATGIRLLIHGRFELLWKGGALTRDGVRGGVFSLLAPALGLPDIGGYDEELVDLADPEPIRMSVKGKLKLGKAATLEISKANPIKLELSPTGGISLKGTAEVVFKDGGRFFADVLLDDPVISLSLRAGNPEVVLMSVLAGLMPENPKQRVPSGTTSAELNTGAADMAAIDRAYKLFIGNARGLRPDGLSDNSIVAAPEIEDLVGAAADSWVTLVKSGLTTDVPAAALIEITTALAEQARGGRSTPAKTVAAVGKLMKLRTTVADLNQPALLAEIDAAITRTRPALKLALKRPGLISSDALGVIAATLAKGEFIYDPELSTAVAAVLQRMLDLMADELGVEEGVTSIAGNTKIQNLKTPAATATKHLKKLAEIAKSASLAGIDPQTLPVLPELHAQLIQFAYQETLKDIDKNLSKGDATGSLPHFEQMDKLQKEEEKFGFAAPNKPSSSALVARLTSLNTLLRQSIGLAPLPDANSSAIREAFFAQAKSFAPVFDVAGRVDGGDAALADVAATIFTRLNALLPSATTEPALAQQTDRNKIFATMQAGTLHATLVRRYPALSSSYDWNAAPIFATGVRLAALANVDKDSAFMFKVLKHLIDEEKKIKKAADKDGADVATLSQTRRRHLQVMAEILDVVRPLAQEEWNIAQSRRNAEPQKYGNDGLLPGNIQVDQVAGSISYHRMSRRLEGRFSGQMKLPNFGSRLTIHAASIDSDGRFDLMASGALEIPGPPESPVVNLSVPVSQPLHFVFAPDRAPRISGRARMAFNNGAVVAVGLRFDDPIYSLQVETTGVKTDLRDAMLAIQSPQLGALDATIPWADYYENFANWFESFEDPDELPDGPFSLDDFMPFGLTADFDASALIQAWLARALAEAQQGSDAFIQGTSEFFTDFVDGYRRSIEHLLEAFDEFFAPNAEERAQDALKRLGEISEFQRQVAELLDLLSDLNLDGGELNLDFATDLYNSAGLLYSRTLAGIQSDPELLKRPDLVREAARSGFELEAGRQILGLDPGTAFEDAAGFLRLGMDAFLTSRGLLSNGTVDFAILQSFDAAAIEETFREFFNFHADLSIIGGEDEIKESHIRGLAEAMANVTLDEAAFDGATGLIDDSGSDEELITRTRRLFLAYVSSGPLLTSPLTPPSEIPFATFLLHKQLIERSKRLPEEAWGQRLALLKAAAQARDLRVTAGADPIIDVEIQKEEERMVNAFLRLSSGRLSSLDFDFLETVSPQRNDPLYATVFAGRLVVAANAIFEETAPSWDASKLPLVAELRREIAQLDALAGEGFSWPSQRSPAFLLGRLTERTGEVAAATRKAKPSASLARASLAAVVPDPETVAVRALFGENIVAIRDAFDPDNATVEYSEEFILASKTHAAQAINDSRDALATRAADPRPLPDPDVKLPGDITISRAVGGFFYNWETGFFKGTFGGRLTFPDPRAFFDIVTATFDSDGSFAISAITGVPVKVMDNDQARLTASIAVAGSSTGLDAFSGTGILTVPLGSSNETYQGTFSYDANAEGKPLTFSAAVGGVQNEFKFGDDFALYSGNLSVQFSTEVPDLLITAGGKAGFFARPDAPAALGADGKFWVVCSISKLEFSATGERLRATFTGGSLKLAQDIFETDPPVGDGFVNIAFAGKLGVDFDFEDEALSFFGNDDPSEPFRVTASNFKFQVPGIEDSAIVVNSCQLELFGDRFPVLNSLDATFAFPLPGEDASDGSERVLAFNLAVEGWSVDGFLPDNVTATLTSDLPLFVMDGLAIDLLGAGAGSFPPVSLSFSQVEIDEETFTRMELAGGMRLKIDDKLIKPAPGSTPTSDDAIDTATGAMRVTVDGSFGWTFAPGQFPDISLNEIQIQGKFLLGGTLEIKGVNSEFASLRIKGFDSIFTRTSTSDPFSIEITASVGLPDVGTFQLDGAKFVWRDPNSLVPDFDLAGAGLVVGDSLSKLLGEFMPLYISAVFLEFLDTGRPLVGGPGVPGRFDLDNIRLILTARAEFPPSPPIELGTEIPSGPRFGGEIRNLRVIYPSGNLLAPEFQVAGVVMGIEGLDIPPLDGIGGQVAILNLDQLQEDPPRPDLVTFVGELKAKFNGPGVGVLLAASPSRIHGVGVSVDLGNAPAGIPLDGYVLGGVLWKGAAGGISFENSFADPTEFATYIQRDEQDKIISASEFPPPGDPGTNPSGIQDPFNEVDSDPFYAKTDLPPDSEGNFDPFDLLTDNWPPRSANPLLEEFPADSGRLIFKGSRITNAEANAFLDSIGVVAGDTRTAEEVIQAFVTAMLADIRAQADVLVADLIAASGVDGNEGLVEHYQNLTDNLIESFDDVTRPILRGILQPVGLADGPSVRDQMLDLLTQGIPGFNVTFLGSGTFTHQFVAPVMDVKGTISVSTTGAALSRGELRMIGIPVAEASLGLSLTKEVPAPTPENPNAKETIISPFLGGLARVGIGPFEIGKLTMAASMPDAASVATFFDEFIECVVGVISSGAEAQLRLLVENATGAEVPVGQALDDFLLARTDAEKLAVAGALFEYFAQAAEETLPEQFALLQDDFDQLLDCFAEFVSASLNALTSEIGFGGKIEPSIFDIPLTASGMPLASARMRYGPVLRPQLPDESLIDMLGNPSANLASGGLPGLREFSAYAQFSPTALLLSPITGTFVALNPTNAALVGLSAVDSAEFGFSFLMEEWTAPKVKIFLTDPARYFAESTQNFFDTAVFGAGYSLTPFGMNLADGQLRAVFPDSEFHPLRPGGDNESRRGNPIRPFDSNGERVVALPTTEELILAAITAGRLKDATFRGSVNDLPTLFPVPGATPPADGNLARVMRVSEELRALDPDLSLLATKTFAKDYFPYGGLIGGGQLAAPQIITRGLPPNWGAIFSEDGSQAGNQERLDAFIEVIEYLTSTDTIGQLAYYIPAPNPVIFPNENEDDVWDNMTIDSLLSRLQMDPASLIGRTINTDLYELDEIVLAGWADATLFGIQLGEARIAHDGDTRTLEAFAQIPPNQPGDGNWFNDFFSGSALATFKLPSEQETELVTYGATELFSKIAENLGDLNSLSVTELEDGIVHLQQSMIDALPRVSMEIEGGVQIPDEFSHVLRSSAGLGFFAFSPFFEPEFEPANFSPYAVAKRRGGVGVQGAFDFGYFPETGDPIVITASGQLSLTPGADIAILPAINGLVEVGEFSIPGAPSFTGGDLQFSSSPDINAPYIAVKGSLEPFVFQLPGPLGPVDLLRAQPLAPATLLGGTFRVLRSGDGPGDLAIDLAIDPMSAAIPLLGPGVAVTMHGGPDGSGGFLPFSFSTAEGQPWSAQIALSAPGDPNLPPAFGIMDPFSLDGQALMTFTPSGPLTGAVSGVGLDSFTATFSAPTGFDITFYPGTPNETVVGTPANENIVLMFDSEGRFYCDLGSLTQFSLPGAISGGSVGARIEFGFNPNDPQPDVRPFRNNTAFSGPLAFGSLNLVNSSSQTFQIRNLGTRAANISVAMLTSAASGDYQPSVDGMQIEPGGERTLTVVFQPRAPGSRPAKLLITSDDPVTPTREIDLTGTGLAQPIYFASRPNVAFRDTLVDSTATTTFTIGNSGSANMTINSVSVTGTAFSVSPTGSAIIAPGQSQNYTVSFTPAALGPATGSFNLNIAAPIGAKSIPLSGNGSESRWVTVLDAQTAGKSTTINALKMLDASEGFAVGDGGTFLQTLDGGRSWIPRTMTTRSLRAIAVAPQVVTRTPVAIYHLDEPPGSSTYLDASGNGRHGIESAEATQRPERSFSNGRFGSGLDFDGVDDFAQLGVIAMPSSFSVSMWARFRSTSGDRTLLAKDSNTGGSQFRFGFYGGNRYEVRFAGTVVSWSAGELLNTWRHLAVTVSYDPSTNTSTVILYRDGISEGSRTITGQVSNSTSNRWKIGTQTLSSGNTRHFNGALDEVMIFDGALTLTNVRSLRAQNLGRIAVVGDAGMVFESYSKGRLWGQLPDLNASGWRNQTNTFQNLNWRGVAFGGSAAGAPMYLAGAQNIGLNPTRAIMVEGINNGEFDLVGITNTPFASNPFMTGIAFIGENTMRATSTDGTYYSQNFQNGANTGFSGASGFTAADLNGIASPGFFLENVAVGNGGKIIRGGSVVVSNTSANLRGIAYRGGITPGYHVVGDGGIYLTSSNNGAVWDNDPDGLTGNMRAVDAMRVPGGESNEYHVWAAGTNHTINYRPPAEITGPFMTFYPGKLDFGFVLAGENRTLETTIVNRGKQPLTISGLTIAGPAAGRFSLGQSSLGQLPLDAAMPLRVRYRPTAESSLDAAELLVTTDDPARPAFRIPLEGRSGTRDWLPVALVSGGQQLDGEVLKVKFTSEIRGYALVQPATGASALYWTNNGGSSWTRSTILVSNVPKLVSMDAVRPGGGTTDVIFVCGRLEDSNGVFQEGVVYRLNLSHTTNPGTFLSPNEIFTQPLAFSDVSAKGSTTTALRVSAVTTGDASTSNVWASSDSGSSWSVSTINRPTNFNGGVVDTYLVVGLAGALATSGPGIHFREFGANWEGQQVQAQGSIRDMQFLPSAVSGGNFNRGWAVGDGGAFLMWTGQIGQSWFPAGDAEVFGTTNLRGVHSGNLNDVWAVGGSKIFDSVDRGDTWKLNFDAGDFADLRCVNSLNGENAWAGGSLQGKATIWRYIPPPSPNLQTIAVTDYRDWGGVARGLNHTRTITVTNNGTVPLQLHDLRIESDEPRSRFEVVSVPPNSLAAGASTNLSVRFSALDEVSLVEQLQPAFFLRFENEWDSLVFTDDSANARHASISGQAAATRPTLALSAFRDRCLRFDGGDHLEIAPGAGPDTFPSSYAVSLWVAPESVSGTRTMISKDTSTGDDLLQFNLNASGYQVRLKGAVFTGGGAPPLRWQHLAANFVESGGSTHVTVYRDGEFLYETTLAATLGNAAGKGWTLGAQWSSSTALNNRFLGCIDDAALVPRALTEAEIQTLATKSPLYGEHRARLVINSGVEGGKRETVLRAIVAPEPRFLTLNTEPQGLPVIVDGVQLTAPVSFAIVPFASTAGGAREWIEGSQHRIEVPEVIVRIHAGGSVSYRFADWSSGPSRQFTLTADRDVALTHTATFVASQIAAPPVAPPPPRAPNGPNPLITALADAPKGPFLRISEGNLTLPNLAGNEFAITGELFLSLSRIQGQLASTAFAVPESGTSKFLEVGPSNWRIDATAGGSILLEARPPSLAILGYDVLPDGLTKLEFQPASGINPAEWACSFQLLRDFKPVPDMLEFKKGGIELRWSAVSGAPAFKFAMDGGVRVVRLTDHHTNDDLNFAFARNVAVRINTVDFDIGVNDLLAAAGQSPPADFVQSGPFRVAWSDVRLQRSGGGPVSLNLLPADIFFHNNNADDKLATLGGSLDTTGALRLNGNLAANSIEVIPGGALRLEKIGAGAAPFSLEISPRRLALGTPSMRLKSTIPQLAYGVIVPGVRFDSTGAFDTGKIALPVFNFDGITVAGPSGGSLAKNHIRLQRDTNNRTVFTVQAEQVFLTCRQELSFSMTSVSNGTPTVKGSISGNFCGFLPEPISLNYNSGSSCQFIGNAFGMTVVFGSSCAGVSF